MKLFFAGIIPIPGGEHKQQAIDDILKHLHRRLASYYFHDKGDAFSVELKRKQVELQRCKEQS